MNLTYRYSAIQFTHWASSTGAAVFATTYLLDKGIHSGVVGVLLALAGICSCLTQPVLASFADRTEKFVLTQMMIIMSALCGVCFILQLIPGIPVMLMAVFYMVGIWSSDAMVPLLNSISVAYNDAGYFVNYGAARGVGAVASAMSSLIVGWVIVKFGITWMLILLLAVRLGSVIMLVGFPQIEQSRLLVREEQKSLSIYEFFIHYRWYCISLLGIAFLGMFHAMTENYLIVIMNALGGNSGHVGIALFIEGAVAAPTIFFYYKIRKLSSDTNLLKVAAVSFLIKAVGFYFAGNITTVYLLEVLQISSYALLAPAQVYYAKEKVKANDMIKGQAFMTAAYALGCSAGNFAGGQLLNWGVSAMLGAGIVMALAGTVLVFVTVTKKDAENCRKLTKIL